MSEIKVESASKIWQEVKEKDEMAFGRIPSFIGRFEYNGQFYDMDADVLDGGFFRGVHAVCGLPGDGKTSACIQMSVRQAEAGYKVLYITQEQDKEAITNKMLAILSGKSFKYWEDVQFKKGSEFKNGKKEGAELLYAYLGDNMKITHHEFKPMEMIEFINKIKDDFDVIYIDNIQNCDLTPGKETEELRHLSNSIARMMEAHKKTALIWLSQLTKEGSHDPRKAKVNYANKLNHDVNTRWVVYRKSEEDEKSEDEVIDVSKTYIALVKNRNSHKPLAKVDEAVFLYDTSKGRIGSFILKPVDERKNQREMDQIKKEAFIEGCTTFDFVPIEETLEETIEEYEDPFSDN